MIVHGMVAVFELGGYPDEPKVLNLDWLSGLVAGSNVDIPVGQAELNIVPIEWGSRK